MVLRYQSSFIYLYTKVILLGISSWVTAAGMCNNYCSFVDLPHISPTVLQFETSLLMHSSQNNCSRSHSVKRLKSILLAFQQHSCFILFRCLMSQKCLQLQRSLRGFHILVFLKKNSLLPLLPQNHFNGLFCFTIDT